MRPAGLWQKRGIGLYWENYEKQTENPITGDPVTATRRRIRRDLDLTMKEEYSAYVERFLADAV